jgi:hypothetical protein
VERIKLPQSVTSVLVQNTVGLRDLVVDVSEERVVDTTEATLLARSVDPSSVSEGGVDRDTNNFGINLAELFGLLAESNNFGGADEGEVTAIISDQLKNILRSRHMELYLQRVEVKNEVLA